LEKFKIIKMKTILFEIFEHLESEQKLFPAGYFGKLTTRGGFHKSWAQGVKHRVHRKSGRQCKKLSASANARCQIRVNLFKKDGRRAQISSVGHKLLYEIHPSSKHLSLN
jgi:hypothetical protein